uniref:Uncharacterized protein n=1 Tax=Salix viminalis TaxID=40686 RepID=A0A6N2K5A7_SALVM
MFENTIKKYVFKKLNKTTKFHSSKHPFKLVYFQLLESIITLYSLHLGRCSLLAAQERIKHRLKPEKALESLSNFCICISWT